MTSADVDVSRITSPAVLQGMVLMQQGEIAELVEALRGLVAECDVIPPLVQQRNAVHQARLTLAKHGA